MDNIKNINRELPYSLNEYNVEPVYYCKHCLSLRIRSITDISKTDYCDKCGSLDINKSSIQEWEDEYKSRYGNDYLDE